jgi:hypothetical protein
MLILPSCVRLTSRLEKTVDGVAEGEVRSEQGEKVPFHQRDDGFAAIRSVGFLRRPFEGQRADLSATKGAQTVKMARPPHNSGIRDL